MRGLRRPDGFVVDALTRAVELLVRQVGHWTPQRWARSGHADRTHALVQRLADRAADAEGQPRRPVPRLPSDLALPDQLKVVAADLVAALPSPALLADAADDVTAVRRTL